LNTVRAEEQVMKVVSGQPWTRVRGAAALVVLMLAASGSCAGPRYGPVPVEGVVSGKHQIPPRENAPETPGKGAPRHFLWIKTKEGPAFVEVSEDVFHAVQEGDTVCLYCEPSGR